MFLQTKKIIISLTTISIILTGCGGGGSSTVSSSTTPTVTTTTTPSSKAIQTGQVKDFNTGKGLANVKVSLGNSTTTTDSNGFYTFSGLSPVKEAIVTFVKEGYLIGSTKIEIKSLSEKHTVSPNYLEYALYASDYHYKTEENIDSSRVFVDTSSLVDSKGNTYSGSAFVDLTILDSTEKAFLPTFPEAFKGINSNGDLVQFISFGLISIDIKDDSGNTLHLSDNDIATLVFHVPSSEKEETIPLWYYDKSKRSWIEEGYAQLQDDGTYKGEVSHLGTWSINKVIDDAPAVYTDRILYPDGTPVQNLRIYAVGKNWITADLSTDENGVFKIEVVPGEAFGLQAYHYSDKYAAKFNGTIPALTAGETVNKIQ